MHFNNIYYRSLERVEPWDSFGGTVMSQNRRYRRFHHRMDWFQPGEWLTYGVLGLLILCFLPLVVFKHPSSETSMAFAIGLIMLTVGFPGVYVAITAGNGGDVMMAVAFSLISGIILAGVSLWIISAITLTWRIFRRSRRDGLMQTLLA